MNGISANYLQDNNCWFYLVNLEVWWDKYMSLERRRCLYPSLNYFEHFNGRFTNQYKIVCSLVNGLRCRRLGEF
ncbi:hypothetical protein H5410_064727 [Solanum commersonii]|uniref:Uncharacterized protein n=1 Tax=Solanum commersonii TaxID=4109 RepID=A0A9J5VZ77_SOLCO|nr:hypothetical protein H5410_064727 [Solanum commersonii]